MYRKTYKKCDTDRQTDTSRVQEELTRDVTLTDKERHHMNRKTHKLTMRVMRL